MDVTERVATGLVCSALDPRLAGVLLLDLDPALIYPLAGWLADLLGDESHVIPIGPEMAEETLWERSMLHRPQAEHPEDLGFRWAPGPLAGYGRPAGVVAVPDLALAGLPATRAAVTLVGAEVAHLQRSGVSRIWHPRDRWLAALRSKDVGLVSPHLLDRFAVRVNARDLRLPRGQGPVLPEADPAWQQVILAARQGAELPVLSAAAADRIVASLPRHAPGIRRDLALGRLARALAALAGQTEVRPGHVDSAAALVGLDAEPVRGVTPLRISWPRALTGPPRGQPIGTQRALDKRDIAVAATLLNAARYQRLRCPMHYREGCRLHVRPADLLSYRRAPSRRHLLVLVLDHTCRVQDWDWYAPLAPYLRWAYVTRALVGVVEMGAATDDARGELRATHFRSRSVLDPRVATALERPPGRATPLAHGLTLAAGMLRHDTQPVGAPVSEALLVVVTDGRANVPLADSRNATPPVNVGESAIRDSEAVARAIGRLRRVRSVVIDPGPRPYGHLTVLLAAALAAPLVHGTAPPAPASSEPSLSVLTSGAM